jgi:hypothetical protein
MEIDMERTPDQSKYMRWGGDMQVAHWIPGRIRVSFEDSHKAVQFAESVHDVCGVTLARANALTGSVLIEYEAETEGVAELLAALSVGPRKRDKQQATRCPECHRALRLGGRSEAIPNLVRLTGSVLSGDVIGIVWWLVSTSMDIKDEPFAYSMGA